MGFVNKLVVIASRAFCGEAISKRLLRRYAPRNDEVLREPDQFFIRQNSVKRHIPIIMWNSFYLLKSIS